jgi:DNA-binding MarR family transcriptional regulator
MSAISPSLTTAAPAPATVLIARIARVVRQRFEQALVPLGLRQREVVALSYLRGHGPTAQQVLAECLCMDPSSTVCLLNDLEDSRLIARARDRADRRRALIQLTAEGQVALSEVDRVVRDVEDQLFGELDPTERQLLRGLLAKVSPAGLGWDETAVE